MATVSPLSPVVTFSTSSLSELYTPYTAPWSFSPVLLSVFISFAEPKIISSLAVTSGTFDVSPKVISNGYLAWFTSYPNGAVISLK